MGYLITEIGLSGEIQDLHTLVANDLFQPCAFVDYIF